MLYLGCFSAVSCTWLRADDQAIVRLCCWHLPLHQRFVGILLCVEIFTVASLVCHQQAGYPCL
jgi:hypothetical protein